MYVKQNPLWYVHSHRTKWNLGYHALQRSLLSTATYVSRQLDKWHWIDFANLSKLLTTLVTASFVSHLGTRSQEKKITILIKFYILLYLNRNICIVSLSLSNCLPTEHNVWNLPLTKKRKKTTAATTTTTNFVLLMSTSCLHVGQGPIRRR